MQVVQENDLISSLTNMISTYMGKNPQLTLNALAQRSNVPVTSLRRLMSHQQKNEIAPHSVLNLVSYILREKNLNKLIERVEPSVAEFLKKHFGQFIFITKDRTYDCDLNTELRDELKYLIYKMAANHDGVDLLTVVESFGSFGKKKVEEMVTSGLLNHDGERLHARNKNFSLDLAVAASHLPALVRFYKPGAIAGGLNSMLSLSEALTEEAIRDIKLLQRECVGKIHAIMNDPKNFGAIPYFTLNLSETMLSEPTTGDLQ